MPGQHFFRSCLPSACVEKNVLVEVLLEHLCPRAPVPGVWGTGTSLVHVSARFADCHASPVAGGKPSCECQVHGVRQDLRQRATSAGLALPVVQGHGECAEPPGSVLGLVPCLNMMGMAGQPTPPAAAGPGGPGVCAGGRAPCDVCILVSGAHGV